MSLKQLRSRAFKRQHGSCFYCGLPMWLASPDEIDVHGLRPCMAVRMRCTAEHLVARMDGGLDLPGNIVAACWTCNVRRHRRRNPPTPEAHRDRVHIRIARGKWHPPDILRMRN